MLDFFKKYRFWISILIVFLAIRIFIFVTFWEASAGRGGWENFYGLAQSAQAVLVGNFHETCDWHPPLYYFLTSVLLFVFSSQWSIYIFQIFLAFISLFFIYKTVRLYFNERIARWSVFLLAIEPFWAWNNFLLVSENLFTPLILAGIYYFFKFLKETAAKNIYFSAIYLALATLTRPNSLLITLALSFLLILIFILRRRLKLAEFLPFNWRRFLISLLIFNLLFFAILTPWLARNKIVYGRFTLANILYTNPYFYNLPPVIALQKNISFSEALKNLAAKADEKLGKNVGDQGDCRQFSKEEFRNDLDFYNKESRDFILANLPVYIKMHIVKATPFFLQSGVSDMWLGYTAKTEKPDMSDLILRGNLAAIKKVFSGGGAEIIVYFFATLFWAIASFALFFAFFYSYFKDKRKFIFFAVSFSIIIYGAMIGSPFIMARYRLPYFSLFIIPFVYVLSLIVAKIKKLYFSQNEK